MPRKAVKDILSALAWKTALVLIISGTGKIIHHVKSHGQTTFLDRKVFPVMLKNKIYLCFKGTDL